AITAQTTAQFRSVTINATGATNFTFSDGAQVLSLGASAGGIGVLERVGGTGAAGTTIIAPTGTLTSGGITTTGTGQELIIRSDSVNDFITLNVPILSPTGAVTKSGLGTLTLGGTLGNISDTFTGQIYLNAGTLTANGTGALNNKNI